MKAKFAATAAAMCLAIASTLAQADPTPAPNYTSPGIGTLVIHWLLGLR